MRDTKGDLLTDEIRDMFFVHHKPVSTIQEYVSSFIDVDRNDTMLIINGFKRIAGDDKLSILEEEVWE